MPNSDFCELAGTLNAEEHAVVKQVRVFMEHKVAPIINKYWADDAFPFELLPALKEPNIDGLWPSGVRLRRRKPEAFLASSPWRWHGDSSFCTFFGAHSSLTMGSICLNGSEEQKRKWLPPMARLEKIGC